jgi:glycosyltransferase involved in cell wall biosynthesis
VHQEELRVMQNVLFVIYQDFTSNSAVHIHALANELCRMGLDCAVAVPSNKSSVAGLGQASYRALDFSEARRLREFFPNGSGPDIVHSWTPREVARKFCESLQDEFRFKLFVHLEDNEEHLFEQVYGRIKGADFPDSLSHPVRYREFLRRAAGITVIIDKLAEFVPAGIKAITLWPGVDRAQFYPRSANQELARRLNLPVNGTTIVYPGNVHLANAREVRSLYLAVAMLNREGYPACLIRTGRDFCEFLDDDGSWVKPYVRDLGFVARDELPEILALADLFVQPGHADRFNEYRFPSKLPEFLAMGKPVILPATNIGRWLVPGRQACVVPQADALQIVESVKLIEEAPELQGQLASGALEFAALHLSWPERASRLRDFYQQA